MLISGPVLCLACQQRTTRMERHLRRVHGFTVEQYRAAFPSVDVVITELVECATVNGRPQLAPGALRCDGRSADRAREYQRNRRAGLRPSAPSRPARDPAVEAEHDARVRRIVAEYLGGRV